MTPIDSTLNCDMRQKIQYMYIYESDIIDLQRIGRLVSGGIGLLLRRLQPIGLTPRLGLFDDGEGAGACGIVRRSGCT